jgi:hypothetical protein
MLLVAEATAAGEKRYGGEKEQQDWALGVREDAGPESREE